MYILSITLLSHFCCLYILSSCVKALQRPNHPDWPNSLMSVCPRSLFFYLYLPVSLQIDKSQSSRPLFHFDCCMSLLVFLLTLHLDVSVLPSIQPTQTARPDPSKLHLTPSPPYLLHLPDRQQIWASPAVDSSIWSSGLQVSHLPSAYVALQIPLSSSPPRLFLSIGVLLCTKAW